MTDAEISVKAYRLACKWWYKSSFEERRSLTFSEKYSQYFRALKIINEKGYIKMLDEEKTSSARLTNIMENEVKLSKKEPYYVISLHLTRGKRTAFSTAAEAEEHARNLLDNASSAEAELLIVRVIGNATKRNVISSKLFEMAKKVRSYNRKKKV